MDWESNSNNNNRERRGEGGAGGGEMVATSQENPLEVEIIDHMRFHEPRAESIFITDHMVPELYDIARDLRIASLILIDNGTRYFLRSVQINNIETDGAGRMTCHYVTV